MTLSGTLLVLSCIACGADVTDAISANSAWGVKDYQPYEDTRRAVYTVNGKWDELRFNVIWQRVDEKWRLDTLRVEFGRAAPSPLALELSRRDTDRAAQSIRLLFFNESAYENNQEPPGGFFFVPSVPTYENLSLPLKTGASGRVIADSNRRIFVESLLRIGAWVNKSESDVTDCALRVLIDKSPANSTPTFWLWQPTRDMWQTTLLFSPDLNDRHLLTLAELRAKVESGRVLPGWSMESERVTRGELPAGTSKVLLDGEKEGNRPIALGCEGVVLRRANASLYDVYFFDPSMELLKPSWRTAGLSQPSDIPKWIRRVSSLEWSEGAAEQWVLLSITSPATWKKWHRIGPEATRNRSQLAADPELWALPSTPNSD